MASTSRSQCMHAEASQAQARRSQDAYFSELLQEHLCGSPFLTIDNSNFRQIPDLCCCLWAGVVTKTGQKYRADLVIDAAGRRSPVPGWLEGGGYAPPPEVEVDPHVTYSSRLYRLPPPPRWGPISLLFTPSNLLPASSGRQSVWPGIVASGQCKTKIWARNFVETLQQAIA